VASYRGDYQLHWRLVLGGEGLSHAVALRWGEMENAKRPDAVADELQHYNNALTLGVSSEGLYLASIFLFRSMHPLRSMRSPLLVPWSGIRVRREKGWVFECVTFAMGHELAIPLRIRGKLAATLWESAGSHWRVEEV
jgi:hypothetical protein